jgi:predicted CoA-binding protein
MTVSTLEDARAFLAARRIAVVGVSRNPKHFSRGVFAALARAGLDVVPVNPGPAELEGRRAFASVREVMPAADAALVLVPPERALDAVRDCLAAGVRRIWFHRGAGGGSASPEALALCREHGVAIVQGLCPYMAIPGAGFPHNLHAYLRQRLAR